MGECEGGFDKARFEKVKDSHKKRLDASLENGMVDKQLVKLCKFINSTKNYSTSSSCSGRIMLLGIPKEGSKKDSYFHRRWHNTVDAEKVWMALNEKSKGELWLKQEPFILHIGCENLEDSRKILAVMRKVGIKRGGIMVAKPGKFIIELQGTQRMSVPVKKGNSVLVERSFIDYLVKRANEKLRKNYSTLKKFEMVCRAELK